MRRAEGEEGTNSTKIKTFFSAVCTGGKFSEHKKYHLSNHRKMCVYLHVFVHAIQIPAVFLQSSLESRKKESVKSSSTTVSDPYVIRINLKKK